MEAKRDDGLTAKQAEFARLVACGHTQADAYRLAYDVKRAKPETVARNASKLMHNTYVSTRVRELLREARVFDIEAVGQAYQQLLDDMQTAREKGNDTALASYTKTKFQAQGMMRDHLVVSAEKSETDDELVARLSSGDPHKATMLRAILGRDTFAKDDEKDDKDD